MIKRKHFTQKLRDKLAKTPDPDRKFKPTKMALGDIPKRGGRPRFEPTDDQRTMVKAMAGFGVRQEDICALIINPLSNRPISKITLYNAFRDELDQGLATANAAVVQNLFRMATSPTHNGAAVAAAIFWTKARLGWEDRQKMIHTGPDGEGPQQAQIQVFLPDNGRGDQPPGPVIEASAVPQAVLEPPADMNRGKGDVEIKPEKVRGR